MTQYKGTRNGSWQPYVPTLGVTSGCRPGVRNKAENFNILHLAKNYQDDRLLQLAASKPSPSAASCAFMGASTVPNQGADSGPTLTATRARYPERYEGSLETGLIPRDEKPEFHAPRPNAFQPRPLDNKREIDGTDRIYRGVNSETFIPPDNLARGLLPFDEFSQQNRKIRLGDPIIKGVPSLGPGLIPYEDISLNIPPSEHPSESNQCQTVYKRIYGTRYCEVGN